MNAFRRWVIGSGFFNIVAATPLALPFTWREYMELFNALNDALGLGGNVIIPSEDAFAMLAVNTTGFTLALLGALLLYAAGDLKNRTGIPLMNAIARLVFVGLTVFYIATADLSRIILTIALIDTVIAGMFIYFILVGGGNLK
jgi:hypothetical protein